MQIDGKKLAREFYLRPTLTVAKDLLRKTVVFHPDKEKPDLILAADIVETEAYIGEDDPACHAAVGKTDRNKVMFGDGGHSYIYFIYGMYHCFNIVTERSGFPAAVLIRAVEPVMGHEQMMENSPEGCKLPTDGPGKFCRAFGLKREHNGIDLTSSELYLVERKGKAARIGVSQRIGIKKGIQKPWRFFDANSNHISR
jgi:DNA-3-methyladenine glycosylase